MAHVVRLRVISEILAVTVHPSIPRFVTIPSGSVIETPDDLVQPGLHSVMNEGRHLFAFAQDIHERTQAVESTRLAVESARLERVDPCPPPFSASNRPPHDSAFQNDDTPQDTPSICECHIG